MYESDISESGHDWQKKNLTTIKGRNGYYDLMECANCGMKGKRYGFTMVRVEGRYRYENVVNCPKAKPFEPPTAIEIITVRASGLAFGNLTPGSIHFVIPAPEGYHNDRRGVWVMGIGEPVKVLREEYKTR